MKRAFVLVLPLQKVSGVKMQPGAQGETMWCPTRLRHVDIKTDAIVPPVVPGQGRPSGRSDRSRSHRVPKGAARATAGQRLYLIFEIAFFDCN